MQWQICVTKLIAIAYSWKGIKKYGCSPVFALFCFVFEGNFQVYSER